ncbi:MAG: LysR family transcriptional regulator ArgP [Candidatus Accumulibacter sp.]|jgi:LysR family transcriptional regulator (chromosome initiation inhibitor)|nr:LysR family transcriptional regulator ArgP [Accumulibacter sp.]
MNPFSPDLLECLAAIIEEGGFERAAKRLSITQSAVSQRLHALETQAGTILIVRGRPLRPTPAGHVLLRHAMRMRLLHADLEENMTQFGAAGGAYRQERISVAFNADSIATWALSACDRLAQEGLQLEIITDDQDFTQDWLREGQVIGCVTALAQALRGCRIVPLGAMRYVAIAAPATLARFCPGGLSPQTAPLIPFVAFNRKDDLQTEFVRQAFGLKEVKLRQCFVPNSEGQVRAAMARWGASVVPELLARPLLDSGELVNLAPDFALPVHLYWHCWNFESDLLDALTQAITTTAKRFLVPVA